LNDDILITLSHDRILVIHRGVDFTDVTVLSSAVAQNYMYYYDDITRKSKCLHPKVTLPKIFWFI